MDHLIQDLRYAIRSFTRNPVFTLTVVACLGLGVGINAAAFSVAHGFLIESLPYTESDRILVVEGSDAEAEIPDGPVVWADLQELRETGLFAEVAAFAGRNVNLTGGDRPERVRGLSVTPGLFPLLGVQPALGRQFAPDEGAPAGFEEAVLISDRLWKRTFAGDPSVLGRTVEINDRALTVVGIMPEGFRFPETHDLWLPLGATDPTDRSARAYTALARLAPGVSQAAAADELDRLSTRLAGVYPDSHRRWRFAVSPIREAALGENIRLQFTLMLGAVSFVLLIACVNVTNLLLARAAGRDGEVGVRSALGASRGRIVRQLLTEAMVLAAAGASLGALVASWMVDLIVGTVPQTEELPHWVTIDVNGPVLLYICGLAVLTALLVGALPAARASKIGFDSALRRTANVGGRRSGALLDVLVGVEVALALVLLLGAGLLMRSVLAIGAADPGFASDRLLTARMVMSGDRYDEPAARAAFFQDVGERLSGLPGVVSATWTGAIPADDGGTLLRLAMEDGPDADAELAVTAVPTTAGLFTTLDVPLVAGRDLTPEEARDPESRSVVIGSRLARRMWPSGEAVGRTLRLADGGELTVVGVAPDLQYEEFGEDTESSRLQVHLPYGARSWRTMALLVRTDGPPDLAAPGVRETLLDADPRLPLFETMSMDRRLRETRWGQQLLGVLFGVYGLAALVLALAGVYGVMAYSVSRRRSEIGLRIALGARTATVLREVAGRGLAISLIGAGVGLAGGFAVTRALGGLLYGVSDTDPVTFIGVTVSMVAAATLAAWIPGRAAARMSPSEALRNE